MNKIKYFDELMFKALKKGIKVELILTKNYDFGIKIGNETFCEGMAWETFEYPVDINWFPDEDIIKANKLIKKFGERKQ